MSKKGQQTYMSSSTYKLARFTFNFFFILTLNLPAFT